nr:dTDP-4-dehydrorhamnose 3,5-epimerase [Pseudomonas lini]
MKFEGTFQYIGNHGIVFNISQITLTDSERGSLRGLHFGEAKNAHYEVNSKVVEVYDKMLAKNLPCVMMIGISKPLTRQQGDALNAQRTTIANLAAAAFTAAAKAVAPLTWRSL